MKRDGNEFSGRITHLFATMMVQVSEEVGEDSDHLTDSTQVPILDQPSTCSKPKKKQTSKDNFIDRRVMQRFFKIDKHEERFFLDLEKAKDAQAKENDALKKKDPKEELTDEEKGKLFMELMKKRRKYFAALRAQEKRNRPPTKAQKRTQMSTYLKHMGGYTYKHLKGKSFVESQKLFDKEIKRVNTFVAMGSEQHQESSKKQRMEEDKESDEVDEVSEDDEGELMKHFGALIRINIAIDAITTY
ncbi:hypothetical protein Tco_1245380 [Tanacetum coccineum]